MTTRAEYLALAERAEAAQASEAAQIIREAVLLCGKTEALALLLVGALLDAALSLVPEGRIVRLLMDPDGRSAAYVNHPGQIADRRLAATPALALVAAALRARAEGAKDE
jgi:hypothetical protein